MLMKCNFKIITVTNLNNLRIKPMVKTKNFNIHTDPKIACTCGHPNCDKRTVKQSHLDRVQLVRDDAMRPLTYEK